MRSLFQALWATAIISLFVIGVVVYSNLFYLACEKRALPVPEPSARLLAVEREMIALKEDFDEACQAIRDAHLRITDAERAHDRHVDRMLQLKAQVMVMLGAKFQEPPEDSIEEEPTQ
jgi:hypothetical protein